MGQEQPRSPASASSETTPQNKIDLTKVEIKPFDRKLRRAAFSCGRDNMDNFLKKSAEDQHKKFRQRVYYAVYENQIVGYYTLSAASRDPNHISEEAIKLFGQKILNAPCVYLGMFATDTPYQRQGVGRKMMVHAMETTLRVAELIGVYALILDAADAEVAERYQKWGFDYFIEGRAEYKMYIPLGTIKSAIRN
jgi:GNAT superfamily N-acetyltransferase